MKYFDFNSENYEYTALIAAKTLNSAIECYNENVEDLSQCSFFGYSTQPIESIEDLLECSFYGYSPQPKEIVDIEAFEMMDKYCSEYQIKCCKQDIKELFNSDTNEGVLMLVDFFN